MREIDNDDINEEFQSLSSVNKKPQIVSGLKRPLDTKPLGEQTCAVRRQELMVILANVGLLSIGIGFGLPTVVMQQLTDSKEAIHLNESQASWFASLNTLSSPIGGLLSGFLLDKVGRKNTLYVLNVISLTAWAILALATQHDISVVYIELLCSRFLTGIAAGLGGAPAGVYSAEISLPKIRGRLILGTSISIATGIMLIYIIGYFIRDDWHLIALLSCGYQIIAILCIMPIPESPNWLISKGRVADAKKSLNYFRGLEKSEIITHPDVLTEFNVLQKSIQLGEGEKKPRFLKSIQLPEVYKPLLILIGLFTFQQLAGIFVVIVYAVQISMEAGVSIDPFMCAVLIGIGRVVTTCPMGIILEKWGRRRAAMISAFGMCVCMFLLAGHRWLQWIPYLPLTAIVAFIVFSTLGLYTLPFFMISELFPHMVRGPASGLTVAVGMFVAFICIKTYPAMKNTIGYEFCFVVYGAMAVFAMVFVYFFLPETRGRTLLEIEEKFRSGKSRRRRRTQREVEMQEVVAK